jgi:hypothetical protein
VEKSKLNLAISLLLLLGIVWLFWTIRIVRTSIIFRLPLLLVAIVAIRWILRDETKPARLLGFFVKTFALFWTVTSIGYFVVWLSLTAPHTYSVYPVHVIIETGMDLVLPISFLLEAISIIIYGIYKIKLKPREIFLSSWYVSMFVFVWRPYQQRSYSEYTGPIHAGAMSDITLGFFIFLLSFLPAAICTILYIKYKKTEI